MKKLTCVFMALVALSAAIAVECPEKNGKVRITSVYCDGTVIAGVPVAIKYDNAFKLGDCDIPATCVTTNVVIAYEITRIRPVPCSCRDGYPGCSVLHYTEKVERWYEKATISEDVIRNDPRKCISSVDEETLQKYSNRNIVPVVVAQDEMVPVGFVSFDMIREVLKRNGREAATPNP